MPSPWLWCHLSSGLSRLQAAPIALPTVFPCEPSFPTSKLPSHPPTLLLAPGVPGGVPSVPDAGWGTYSRGLVKPRQGSPPARGHLRFSVVPVVSPHSLSCGTLAGRNSPKARAAFWGAMPGPGSPSALGTALPRGLLAALEGPAQHCARAQPGYSSGEEHLRLSAKIINSALEFLTWQQSPRKREWLLRGPAGTAWGAPVALAEGVRRHSGRLAVWAEGQLPTRNLSTGPAECTSV